MNTISQTGISHYWGSYMRHVQEINQQYHEGHITFWNRYQLLMDASRVMFGRPTQEGFTCDLESFPEDITWMQLHPQTACNLIKTTQTVDVLCEIARLSTCEGIIFGYAYVQHGRVTEADKIMGELAFESLFHNPKEEVFFYCPWTPNVPATALTEVRSLKEQLIVRGKGQISEVFVSVLAPIPYAPVKITVHGTQISAYLPPAWGSIHAPRERFVLFGSVQEAYRKALREETERAQHKQPLRYIPEDMAIFSILGIQSS